MENNQVTLNLCVIKGNTNNICYGSLLIQRGCPVSVPCEQTTRRVEPLHRLLVDLLTKWSRLVLHTDSLVLYSPRGGEDVRMTGRTSSEHPPNFMLIWFQPQDLLTKPQANTKREHPQRQQRGWAPRAHGWELQS